MLLSLVATMVKRLGALCLVSVIVWHLCQNSDGQPGKAIVHLPQPDILVSVDQHFYPIESIEAGRLICTLQPGAHVLRVWRRGRLLCEQSLQIAAGEEVDVRPLDPDKALAMPKAIDPLTTSRAVDRPGLVVHDRRPEPRPHL